MNSRIAFFFEQPVDNNLDFTPVLNIIIINWSYVMEALKKNDVLRYSRSWKDWWGGGKL